MLASYKILIVDDDKDDQAFLSEAISELYPDCKYRITKNGQEALDYIKSDPPPPHFIFLDLNMPVLNGFEFLRNYRRSSEAADSKIIIYSTSSNPREKEMTRDLGANEYMVKPTDYDKLKRELKKLIDKYSKN